MPRAREVDPIPWLYTVTRVLCPFSSRVWLARLDGLEHLPRSGPALLASNHASFLDPWFIGLSLPRRPIRNLITARWYYRSALWRAAFRAYGTIPTDPRDPRGTIAAVVEAVRSGDCVTIFPEGRVSPDGRLQRGRVGLGHIAAISGAPVVPIGLRGNHEILPRDRRVPRFARLLEIRLGPPRTFPDAPVPEPDRRAAHRFVEEVMRDIARLSGQSLSAT